MLRGVYKEKIFSGKREKTRALELLFDAIQEYDVEIYAYSIMNTHIHILIKAELQVLSAFIHFWASAYGKYYNYIHDRFGHVFQSRFKSQCIEDDSYFYSCMRYIHLNPVKAGYVERVDDYKFGSMQEYKMHSCHIINEKALRLYGKNFVTYRDFYQFHQKLEEDLFLDIQSEVEEQELMLVIQILTDLQKRHNCDTIHDLLTRSRYKGEAIKELAEKLKFTRTKISRILKIYE